MPPLLKSNNVSKFDQFIDVCSISESTNMSGISKFINVFIANSSERPDPFSMKLERENGKRRPLIRPKC